MKLVKYMLVLLDLLMYANATNVEMKSIHLRYFSNNEQSYTNSACGYMNAWLLIPNYLETCSFVLLENIKSHTECSVRGLMIGRFDNVLAILYDEQTLTCRICIETNVPEYAVSRTDKPF